MIPKEKTGDNGILRRITKDAILAAIEEFIGKPRTDANGNVAWQGGNEYWRDLFMGAPAGARMRLALNFFFSENHKKPNFPMLEYRALRKAIEDAIDFDSLEYLIANEYNDAAKKHFTSILNERRMKNASAEHKKRFAAMSDDEWFKVFRRASTVTSKAGGGMGYLRDTGKPFPVEAYKQWEASLVKNTSCWKGVWVSDAIYAAAPELAKRYYENVRWVEFVGKDAPPVEQDGRKMTQPEIFTMMQDADWDYIIKHIHSYARGMPVAMARRHYQHKDVLGNPIEE